jgi:hypothetical protein
MTRRRRPGGSRYTYPLTTRRCLDQEQQVVIGGGRPGDGATCDATDTWRDRPATRRSCRPPGLDRRQGARRGQRAAGSTATAVRRGRGPATDVASKAALPDLAVGRGHVDRRGLVVWGHAPSQEDVDPRGSYRHAGRFPASARTRSIRRNAPQRTRSFCRTYATFDPASGTWTRLVHRRPRPAPGAAGETVYLLGATAPRHLHILASRSEPPRSNLRSEPRSGGIAPLGAIPSQNIGGCSDVRTSSIPSGRRRHRRWHRPVAVGRRHERATRSTARATGTW